MLLYNVLLLFISFTSQGLMVFYFVGRFARVRRLPVFVIVNSVVIAIGSVLDRYLGSIPFLITLLITIVFLLLSAQRSKALSLLYFFTGVVAMNVFTLPIYAILYYSGYNETNMSPLQLLIFNILLYPFLILIWLFDDWLFRKIAKIEPGESLKALWRYLPFLMIESIMLFFVHALVGTYPNPLVIAAAAVIFIGLFVLDLLLFDTIRRLEASNKLELQKSQLDAALHTQSSLFQQHIENTSHIRKLYHDMSNQLSGIRYLIESGNYDLALNQIGSFSDEVSQAHNMVYSGNPYVDSMIQIKKVKAEESTIKFDFSGTLPVDIPVAPASLCSIAANLLDNALNASLNLPPDIVPKISFSVGIVEQYAVFRCINACLPSTATSPENSFSDLSEHGWGLQIIRDIATANDGTAAFYIEDGKFYAIVSLKIHD